MASPCMTLPWLETGILQSILPNLGCFGHRTCFQGLYRWAEHVGTVLPLQSIKIGCGTGVIVHHKPNKTYQHYNFYPETTHPSSFLFSLYIYPSKNNNMPMRRTAPRTTRTTARPSLKTRLLGGKRRTHTKRNPVTGTTTTTTTTTRTTRTSGGTTAAPVHHHKRHATMGDKVSGALMKIRGSLTRRPGLKVSPCQLFKKTCI